MGTQLIPVDNVPQLARPTGGFLRGMNDGRRLVGCLVALIMDKHGRRAAELAANVNGSLAGYGVEQTLFDAVKTVANSSGDGATVLQIRDAIRLAVDSDGDGSDWQQHWDMFVELVANIEHIAGPRPAHEAGIVTARLATEHASKNARHTITNFLNETHGKPIPAEALIALAGEIQAVADTAGNRPTLLTGATLAEAYFAAPKVARIATGLRWFDDAVGGLERPGVTVFGGPPGCAKSSLAMALALGAIEHGNARVVWGLGEMSVPLIMQRVAAAHYGDGNRGPRAALDDFTERTPKTEEMAGVVFDWLGDRFSIETNFNIDALEAAVVRSRADVLVVDYFQRLRPTKTNMEAVERAEHHGHRLAEIAERHGVAVIAISAVAKAGLSGRGGHGGIGAATKGSGGLDYDASMYFAAEVDDEQSEDHKPHKFVRWRCLKNRNGTEPVIELVFDGGHQHFRPAESAVPVDEFASW